VPGLHQHLDDPARIKRPHWLDLLEQEDYQALTPLVYNHITPYGLFELDMEKRLLIE
jgi:hypothetical protein